MKFIYVCSPCRGNPPYEHGAIGKRKTSLNIWRAGLYCREVIDAGHIPIAPHYFYSDFLKDKIPEQRTMALEACRRLLSVCNELWVLGTEISEGMEIEITLAKKLRIPVVYREQ